MVLWELKDAIRVFAQSFLAHRSCPHDCKKALRVTGISSTFHTVRRGRADGKMSSEPVGGFPESQSIAFLSFWPQLCPMATLDAKVVRNLSFASKLCQLRLK